MYHQKNGAKVRVFPRWQTKSLFFFLPSVKNPEYFPLSEIKQ